MLRPFHPACLPICASLIWCLTISVPAGWLESLSLFLWSQAFAELNFPIALCACKALGSYRRLLLDIEDSQWLLGDQRGFVQLDGLGWLWTQETSRACWGELLGGERRKHAAGARQTMAGRVVLCSGDRWEEQRDPERIGGLNLLQYQEIQSRNKQHRRYGIHAPIKLNEMLLLQFIIYIKDGHWIQVPAKYCYWYLKPPKLLLTATVYHCSVPYFYLLLFFLAAYSPVAFASYRSITDHLQS